MTVVRKAPGPRQVAVGDVITAKPFGGHVQARGRVFLVTEHAAYYRCASRSCPGCAPNRFDSNRWGAHRVWRTWLDWYRDGNDEDRDIRDSLADREMRTWDAATRKYVAVQADSETTEPRRAS